MDQKKHLIAIDLDDTTLQDLRNLNEQSAYALKKANETGHKVMIVTARPLCIAKPFYEQLNLDTPIGLLNGADCISFSDNQFKPIKQYIASNDMKKIYDCIPSSSMAYVWLENNNDLYVTDIYKGSSYFDEVYFMSNVHSIALSNLPIIDVGRLFLWLKDTDELENIIARLNQIKTITVTYRKWNKQGDFVLFSIKSAKADKWNCVKYVAEYYNIPIENTIAFGDEMNDEMMLRNANFGYVMKNGNEKLKEIVGRVTQEENIFGGVGKEINRLLNLDITF